MPEPIRQNPYVGPRAFKTGEALYGRERETRELLDLLIAERIVLLHSPSGAGKSSLIQAALIPRLAEEENFWVLPIIRVNEPPANAPSGAFNRYVFSTLHCLESNVPADRRLPPEALFEMRLPDYVDQRLKSGENARGNVVLIFDQFEEIISLDPTDQSAKTAFFAQVGQTLRDQRRWALFSLRGDYKAAIEPYARPIPTRLENAFSLGLLGPNAAHEAIQQPARLAGVDFVDSAVQKLVDDLRTMRVQQIDGAFDERPGPNVEPVQLQVVCVRLWQQLPPDAKQITEADIESVGEVDDALAGYYADVVQDVSDKTGVRKRLIRTWFEDHLITKQGLRSQVLREQEQSAGLDNRAIELLENAHLVRADKRSGSTWYELAHDRLIAPIRNNNAEWFKTNLSLLQRQADLWRRADYPDTLLLRDAALDEAEQWAREHDAELIRDERELLKASQEIRAREQEAIASAEQKIKLEAAERLAAAERQRAEEQEQAAQRLRARNRVIQRLGIAALFLSVLAIVGFVVALNQAQLADRNRLIAEYNQGIADQNRIEAQHAQATAEAAAYRESEVAAKNKALFDEAQLEAKSVQLASYSSDANVTQPDLALLLSLEAMQLTDAIEAKTSLLEGLMRNSHLVTFLRDHTSWVDSVAFSPDGKTVAAAGQDGIRLWDTITGTPIGESIKSEFIVGTAFSPDGRQLAAKDDSGGMTLWEWATGTPRVMARPVRDLGQELDTGNLVVFSPDGKLLATSGYDFDNSAIFVWDVTSGQLLSPSLPFSTTYVSRLAFDPDSKTLAAGYDNGAIVLWDIASRKPLSPTFSTGASRITLLQYDEPVTTTLVSADESGKFAEWDTKSGEKKYDEDTGLQNANAVWSAKARQIVFGGKDNILTLSENKNIKTPLTGHAGRVTSFALSPDGSRLVSGDATGQVILWRTSGTPLSSPLLRDRASAVVGAAYSQASDGNTLVSVDNDQIIVWNTAGQMPTVTTAISPAVLSEATTMALSPDGKTLALGTQAGSISMWDLDQHRRITEVPNAHTAAVSSLTFSPTGRVFVSIGEDGKLVMWDAANAQKQREITLTESIKASAEYIPSAAAFSPTGDRLVISYDDGSVALLDPVSLALFGDGGYDKLHADPVSRIAFDSAGNFATGSDSEIYLWSGAAHAPLGSVQRADSSVNRLTSLAFSPDGKTLLEGTSSGAIVLWDVADAAHPQRVAELTGHTGPVTTLAFSPDGQSLVSGSDDLTLQLWQMRPDEWKAAACRVAARNLTAIEWAAYLYFKPYHATCSDFPVYTRDIVAGYLEQAKRNANFNQTAAMVQSLKQAQDLSNQSQDFYVTEPICEFTLERKMEDTSRQNCQRAVELSLQANSYDQTFSICQLGISNDLKELVLPACARTDELSAKSDDYVQPHDFCEFGVLNGLTEVALPACTRAIELSVKSDDYDQMYDMCALGAFFKLEVDFPTACQNAAKLGLASEESDKADAGYLYALAGKIDQAKSLFKEAEQEALSSGDPASNNRVCWPGSITGLVEIARVVLPACERGVNLTASQEREPPRRDSRGVARALLGDTRGAIEDFQSLVDWLRSGNGDYDSETRARYVEERLSFIKALEAGQNPFDDKTLYLIRNE